MKLKHTVLFFMIGVSVFFAVAPNQMVLYGQAANKRMDVNLGVNGLENPTSTTGGSSQWTGSKIYFGDDDNLLWKVLDKNQGSTSTAQELFLLMDQALEQPEQYHNSFKAVTWEKCTLRTLLNGEGNSGETGTIYDELFDEQEKKVVCQTESVNQNNPSYNTDGGNVTNDFLFLLSSKDATNAKYGFGSNAARSSNEYWWLRTIGYNGSNAAVVDENGGVFEHGLFTQKEFSVYPAFNLDASQVFLTSASDIVKGDFESAREEKVSQNLWKLTLKDGNTTFQATLPKAGKAGETISVDVTSLGDKTYMQVSAMIVDGNGTTKAYGKIADGQTGEVDIMLPNTLLTGSYQLYVFPENIYVGNTMDYAGNYVLENNFVVTGDPSNSANKPHVGNTSNTGDESALYDTEDEPNTDNQLVQEAESTVDKVIHEIEVLDDEVFEESGINSEQETTDDVAVEDSDDTYGEATKDDGYEPTMTATKTGLSNVKKISIVLAGFAAVIGGIALLVKKIWFIGKRNKEEEE